MSLPVWGTVLISNWIAGFIARRVDVVLVLPVLLGNAQSDTLARNVSTWLVVDTLVNTVITALILFALLPVCSSLRASFGTAFMGSLAGQGVVFVGSIVLLRATLQSNLASGGGMALVPALGLLSFGLMALGIYITSTVISSSATGSGDHGGGNAGLYGGQAYLDQFRNTED